MFQFQQVFCSFGKPLKKYYFDKKKSSEKWFRHLINNLSNELGIIWLYEISNKVSLIALLFEYHGWTVEYLIKYPVNTQNRFEKFKFWQAHHIYDDYWHSIRRVKKQFRDFYCDFVWLVPENHRFERLKVPTIFKYTRNYLRWIHIRVNYLHL